MKKTKTTQASLPTSKQEPRVIKSIFQPSWPSQERMNELMGIKAKSALSIFYRRTIIQANEVMSLSVSDQVDVASKMWNKCSAAARAYLMNCDFIAVAEAAHESAKREAKKINAEAKAAKLLASKGEKVSPL